MTLGEKLRKLRAAKNLTQTQLAALANVGTTTIVYAEAIMGEKRPARFAALRFDTLVKIAEHLDVPADSKEFQELAVLWLEDQLGTAVSAARSRKVIEKTSSKGTEEAIAKLVESASQNLNAESISLVEWATREPRVMHVLRTLKDFQDTQPVAKPTKPKRAKKK